MFILWVIVTFKRQLIGFDLRRGGWLNSFGHMRLVKEHGEE